MAADLIIYGASDDVVALRHSDAVDEYDGTDVWIVLRERGSGAGCVVKMTYTEHGLWAATIQQFATDVDSGEIIPWEIVVGHHPQRDYTVLVTVREFTGTIDVSA